MSLKTFVEAHAFGRWLTNFLLIFVLFLGGVYVHNENTKWHPILCASKTNLQNQIDDSWRQLQRQHDFLYQWDTGARTFKGFTRADIVLSINDTQETLNRQTETFKAFKDLNCKGDNASIIGLIPRLRSSDIGPVVNSGVAGSATIRRHSTGSNHRRSVRNIRL